MKKRLLILIAFLLLIVPTFVFASTNTYPRDENNLYVWEWIDTSRYKEDILKTPRVESSEKIYDFANLLTDEEEKRLFDKVNVYIEKYNMDLVFVTINENNKDSARSYAEDFYIYNFFGTEEKKRSGSIFIIDMDNRDYYLASSGSAILHLSDSRIDNILDTVFDDVKGEKYYNAMTKVIDMVTTYSNDVPSSNSNYEINENGEYVKLPKVHKFHPFVSIGGALLIAGLFVGINVSRHKSIKLATNADYYLDKEKSKLAPAKDAFLSTHTSVTTIPKSTGGSSGGSSTHIGGGGHTFGGGGRHF
jgi:uncharacterized protein